MGKQVLTFEFEDDITGTIYLTTGEFVSTLADTPSDTPFESRIVGSLEFSRSISTHFWGGKPRGTMGFTVMKVANGDGRFDYLREYTYRDYPFILKMGDNTDDYATLTTIASGLIDRIEFEGEDYLNFYLRGTVSVLDRAVQQSVYPSTVPNKMLQGQPRPLVFGTLYQVPLIQPSPYGYGDYDLHDNDNWLGITSFYDRGVPLSEAGVKRSIDSSVFGVVRITKPADSSKQCADVIGAFRVDATTINEPFTSGLGAWTETNGGVGGRDASIASSQLSMVNTLGGADLSITNLTTLTMADGDYAYYEFTVNSFTGNASPSLEFRAGGTVHAVITGPGKYRGIITNNASTNFAFVAVNGCNCKATIDNFILREVTPLSTIADYVEYFCTSGTALSGKGPLAGASIGSTVAALSSSLGYSLSQYVDGARSCADLMDDLAVAIGGYWYEDANGLLQIGQLTAPTGTPVLELDDSNVVAIKSVAFDQAEGLTDTISAQRNWSPYDESDIAQSLRFTSWTQTTGMRKDADVAISTAGYTYTITATGSVLCTVDFPGGKYYWEDTPSSVANFQYIGTNSPAQAVTNIPATSGGGVAYRNDGNARIDAASTAYGNSYTAADVISVVRDSTMSMAGARRRANKHWFGKNGTIQNSGVVDGAGFLVSTAGSTAISAPVVGANATSNNGGVNFGQAAFAYAIPDEYIAPAWLFSILQREYRYTFTSATGLHSDYASAVASVDVPILSTDARTSSRKRNVYGTGTILSKMVDARAEQNRRNAMYATIHQKWEIDVALSGPSALVLLPGDLVNFTYPRLGADAGILMRIISISGDVLGGQFKLNCWS